MGKQVVDRFCKGVRKVGRPDNGASIGGERDSETGVTILGWGGGHRGKKELKRVWEGQGRA